jgi:hypothetical protein
MVKWSYKILICFGTLVLLVKLADWAARRGQDLPVQPKPNGYEVIVSAASSIKPLPADFGELASDQIRQIAQENHPALEQVRKSFEIDSGVTLEITKDWQDRHEQDLKELKRLAIALGVESKSQLLSGHTNDAARCHVDVIRLAQSLSKGGILLDGITSLMLEAVGTASLQSLLPQLDATVCRNTAIALEELQAKREKPETIIATEKAWSARRFGLVDRIGDLLGRKANAKRFTQFIQRSHETSDRTQRLMLRLATRAYELDHHQPPAKVSDLVPTHLIAAPRASESGKEILEFPPMMK